MVTIYQCEICGFKSTNKTDVIKCEKRGIPLPLIKEGQIITFEDCEETPLMLNERYKRKDYNRFYCYGIRMVI